MLFKKCFIKLICTFTIFIFIFSPICFSIDDIYVWSNEYISTIQTNSFENKSLNSENSLNLESESGILIDQESGEILYQHNIHEQLRPASVTKIMSILLIMEAIDSGKISLQDMVPCSEKARSMGGSQIWLNETESLTVNEMPNHNHRVMDWTMIVSAGGNTGSKTMSSGKIYHEAKDDKDVRYVYASYDIALMSRELLKNHPTITNYTTIWMDTLRNGKSELVNTNKLIRNYKGATRS